MPVAEGDRAVRLVELGIVAAWRHGVPDKLSRNRRTLILGGAEDAGTPVRRPLGRGPVRAGEPTAPGGRRGVRLADRGRSRPPRRRGSGRVTAHELPRYPSESGALREVLDV